MRVGAGLFVSGVEASSSAVRRWAMNVTLEGEPKR